MFFYIDSKLQHIFYDCLLYLSMSLFLIICILFAKNRYLQIIVGLLYICNMFIINNNLLYFLLMLSILNIIFNIIFILIYKN